MRREVAGHAVSIAVPGTTNPHVEIAANVIPDIAVEPQSPRKGLPLDMGAHPLQGDRVSAENACQVKGVRVRLYHVAADAGVNAVDTGLPALKVDFPL